MHNLQLFLSTFALIFIAELPDKTAFATVLLATRGRPFAVWIGVSLAFLLQTLVAVAFGSVLRFLPPSTIHYIASIMFLIFAVVLWIKSNEKIEQHESTPPTLSFGKAVWSSFLVIFIAEWGDLTQLATATLIARTHSILTVFTASVLALWTVTAVAVLIGHHASRFIKPKPLQRVAAIAFALVAIYMLLHP